MKLDGATFLLQWASGGLVFGWITTRRREVSLGYGWLIRITFGLMALGAFALFVANDHPDAASFALVMMPRPHVPLSHGNVRVDTVPHGGRSPDIAGGCLSDIIS